MTAKKKLALATGFVGVAALATTMFGQVVTSAQEGTPTPKAPRNEQRLQQRAQRDGCGRPGAARRHRLARRLVHSESKVQLREGFAVITVDHGEITATNAATKTVTLERADGVSVTVTAEDSTKICRDGKPATVGDLKVGDHAGFVQGDANGEHHVRRIVAVSENASAAAPAAQRSAFAGELDADLGLPA